VRGLYETRSAAVSPLFYHEIVGDKVSELINAKKKLILQAPEGIHVVCKRFPLLKIVTSEIDAGLNAEFRVVPGMGGFGDRYFGTDADGPDQSEFKRPVPSTQVCNNIATTPVYNGPLKSSR
jgi:hypothetical protein